MKKTKKKDKKNYLFINILNKKEKKKKLFERS